MTKEFRDSHSKVEWRDIIAMRHILVHDYNEVNMNILWNVIAEELPAFKKQIEAFISEMD